MIESLADEDLRECLLTELEGLRRRPSADVEQPIRENFAFIAMSMDPNNPELDDILDAIKEGASSCGVTAERIDEEQTNEPITKRMLTAITESEFVVVDLTHARPNVYYEAGYAQGLGKIPIYIAKQDAQVHFDIQDYPVIFFRNLRSMRSSLADRLNAIRDSRKQV
ncbi:MAG: hypothetical protein F6K42_04745 [Leptolyngbya sp. SIO1D8]|nr:hypothetical protein [Leptolyngbya sp. SIO1D8]